MGLSLPVWCSKECFEKLGEISAIAYRAMTCTETIRRKVAGPMIDKFIENINLSEGDDGDKKIIYLYSGHATNIAVFNEAHNFTGIPRVPDFGSAIIFEKLRGQDNQVYIQVCFTFKHSLICIHFYLAFFIKHSLFRC